MKRMSSSFLLAAGVLGVAVTVVAQSRPRPGDPLPGLTATEFAEFRLGLEDFLEVEVSDEGLGPAYNGTSCAVCHNVPAVGGMGVIAELRAARTNDQGEFIPLDESGETLFQLFSVPGHGCQVAIPETANVFARRIPIPLFGAGLIAAIPDASILARDDPEDANNDGISGRAARIIDIATNTPRIGRFGWKAQHATLLAFSGDAYRNEMGITNDLFPKELAVGVTADQMRACDPFPDPEDLPDLRTRRRGIDNFTSFMQFLAPVERLGIDAEIAAGDQVFAQIGCAACHVPEFVTGSSQNPLFHQKTVALFSDLLLHDIGTGDGIKQASAAPAEIRTPALWGLRFRRLLLHDGSAATIEQAIQRHANEAAFARKQFEILRDADRAALIKFLKSL